MMFSVSMCKYLVDSFPSIAAFKAVAEQSHFIGLPSNVKKFIFVSADTKITF